jgi:hypothetical protein
LPTFFLVEGSGKLFVTILARNRSASGALSDRPDQANRTDRSDQQPLPQAKGASFAARAG